MYELDFFRKKIIANGFRCTKTQNHIYIDLDIFKTTLQSAISIITKVHYMLSYGFRKKIVKLKLKKILLFLIWYKLLKICGTLKKSFASFLKR